jgi:hypothetical protein
VTTDQAIVNERITDQKKKKEPIKKASSPHRFEEKYAQETNILFCAALSRVATYALSRVY